MNGIRRFGPLTIFVAEPLAQQFDNLVKGSSGVGPGGEQKLIAQG